MNRAKWISYLPWPCSKHEHRIKHDLRGIQVIHAYISACNGLFQSGVSVAHCESSDQYRSATFIGNVSWCKMSVRNFVLAKCHFIMAIDQFMYILSNEMRPCWFSISPTMPFSPSTPSFIHECLQKYARHYRRSMCESTTVYNFLNKVQL